MKWRYTKRKIDGKTRNVKVSKNGRYVRIVGYKNYTDKSRIRRKKK